MTYGYRHLGSLHQAPDGTVYQTPATGPAPVQDLTQIMGIGALGEVRQGPDGNLYQWVQGADGLGNPIGFWNLLTNAIQSLAQPLMQVAQPLLQRLTGGGGAPSLPIPPMPSLPVSLPTPFRVFPPGGFPVFPPGGGVPAGGGLTVDPEDLSGQAGLGDIGQEPVYESPDGTRYQIQGFDEDEPYMQGFDGNDPYSESLEADEEYVSGLYADDEYIQGSEDYESEAGVRGLDAYVPEERLRTPWARRSSRPPRNWEPPW
jgi:hypothetical protein